MLKADKQLNMNIAAEDMMTKTPKTILEDAYAVEALDMMRKNQITSLLVTDKDNNYLGVVHLHDLIQEGII